MCHTSRSPPGHYELDDRPHVNMQGLKYRNTARVGTESIAVTLAVVFVRCLCDVDAGVDIACYRNTNATHFTFDPRCYRQSHNDFEDAATFMWRIHKFRSFTATSAKKHDIVYFCEILHNEWE